MRLGPYQERDGMHYRYIEGYVWNKNDRPSEIIDVTDTQWTVYKSVASDEAVAKGRANSHREAMDAADLAAIKWGHEIPDRATAGSSHGRRVDPPVAESDDRPEWEKAEFSDEAAYERYKKYLGIK